MTSYSLIPVKRRPFNPQAMIPDNQSASRKSCRQRRRELFEVLEVCYEVVPTVLHQIQQQYPQTKFTCSKSKAEIQEEVQKGNCQPLCAWRLTQEAIVLRVVLNIDDYNSSLAGSLTCYFGSWQEQCAIDADELATILTKLIALHGGWTPAIDHVPLHPYAG